MPRDCRVFVAIQPGNQWGFNEIFQNKSNHLLELLLWQNAYDPKNKTKWKANKPKPFVPDFMKQRAKPSEIVKEAELHTTDEVRDILSLPRG